MAAVQDEFACSYILARDIVAALLIDGYLDRRGATYVGREWNRAAALEVVAWMRGLSEQSLQSWGPEDSRRMMDRLGRLASQWKVARAFDESDFVLFIEWHSTFLTPGTNRGIADIAARVALPGFFRMLWESCYAAFADAAEAMKRISTNLDAVDLAGVAALWEPFVVAVEAEPWPRGTNPVPDRHEIWEPNIAGRLLPFGRRIRDQEMSFPPLVDGQVPEQRLK